MFLLPGVRTRVLLAVTAALWLVGCDEAYETTLPNGLRVIVKQDHRAPVVVSQVWYRVGSMDEPEGLTGISHVLEHMMFKGTERLKPNEFSRIIAENGGRENAFTSTDYTAYFQQLEKSRLPISFDLESERMHNLRLDAAEFEKEIKVVMEERRLRTEDQPEALVYEEFMSTAYRKHPYRHPIIGWMRDLESIEARDLRHWYERFYSPKNATLVVVGDVEPQKVVALAREHFGAVPSRPVDRRPIPEEPPQTGERRTRVRVPAEVPYLLLGFHVPVLRDDPTSWEPYALSVLAGILDGGNAARFARELVRAQKLAASVDVGYSPVARAPGMLLIDGTPAADHDVADLEGAIRAQLDRLKTELVSVSELRRVKAQVAAQNVYARDSMFYQAMQIGRYAAVGLDWQLIDQYVERVNRVTAEQVRSVARKYLLDTNLTVAVLDPLPIDRGTSRPAPMRGTEHVR